MSFQQQFQQFQQFQRQFQQQAFYFFDQTILYFSIATIYMKPFFKVMSDFFSECRDNIVTKCQIIKNDILEMWNSDCKEKGKKDELEIIFIHENKCIAKVDMHFHQIPDKKDLFFNLNKTNKFTNIQLEIYSDADILCAQKLLEPWIPKKFDFYIATNKSNFLKRIEQKWYNLEYLITGFLPLKKKDVEDDELTTITTLNGPLYMELKYHANQPNPNKVECVTFAIQLKDLQKGYNFLFPGNILNHAFFNYFVLTYYSNITNVLKVSEEEFLRMKYVITIIPASFVNTKTFTEKDVFQISILPNNQNAIFTQINDKNDKNDKNDEKDKKDEKENPLCI